MFKRHTVTKLLAVAVVSLAGCEELAPPPPASTLPASPTPVTSSAPTTGSPATNPSAEGIGTVVAPATPATTPRTTPDGRPACGNVASRLSAEMRAAKCKPRTHRNGSPAEGNITTRAVGPTKFPLGER